MAEYLEREKIMGKARLACVIALCDEDPNLYPDVDFADTFAVDLDDICEMDAADVAPVMHGRWIKTESLKPKCSVCGVYRLYAWSDHRKCSYCPNCGAKMDAKGRETDG